MLWTRSKAFSVSVDVIARYSFSVNFCASSSSCCCTIVTSSPSLMIVCSFSSRFCRSYSSSRISAKESWAYLGELIYHLFGTYLLRSIFDRQFRKVFLLMLQQCSKDFVVISGRSKPFVDRWPYMCVLAVWVDIGLCHWPRRWVFVFNSGHRNQVTCSLLGGFSKPRAEVIQLLDSGLCSI